VSDEIIRFLIDCLIYQEEEEEKIVYRLADEATSGRALIPFVGPREMHDG
jgi:hypothetical protein